MAKVVMEKPRPKQPRRSTDSPSIWELGGLTPIQLGKRLWTTMDVEHDDTFDRAAELAFWFFLAVFPGLILLMTIFGFVAGSNPALRDGLFRYAGDALPGAAFQLLQRTVTETSQHATGLKLILGLLAALWSASGGIASLMTVMNFTYQRKETRGFAKTRLVIAPLLTIALTALMLAALGIVLFGNHAANWAGMQGLGDAPVLAWKVVQWPVALFFVVLSFAMLYFYAPDVEQHKWYWITPGAVIGVLLWILASAGFRLYLHFSNTYSATYGSVAAVIILMMWFYITALALLVGAEINATIEHAAAERGRADAKLKGEKEAPAA